MTLSWPHGLEGIDNQFNLDPRSHYRDNRITK